MLAPPQIKPPIKKPAAPAGRQVYWQKNQAEKSGNAVNTPLSIKKLDLSTKQKPPIVAKSNGDSRKKTPPSQKTVVKKQVSSSVSKGDTKKTPILNKFDTKVTIPKVVSKPPLKLALPTPEPIKPNQSEDIKVFLKEFFKLKLSAYQQRNDLAIQVELRKERIRQNNQQVLTQIANQQKVSENNVNIHEKAIAKSIKSIADNKKRFINVESNTQKNNLLKTLPKDIAVIEKSASDQLISLEKEISLRKKDFDTYVIEQKGIPHKAAIDESNRADTELDAGYKEAIKIGNSVAQKYNDPEKGSDQKEATKEVAKEGADDIITKKPGIREETIKMANDFGGNYDAYTLDLKNQLDLAKQTIANEINKIKADAIQNLNNQNSQVIVSITQTQNQNITLINEANVTNLSSLKNTKSQTIQSLKQQYNNSKKQIQLIEKQTFEGFDDFLNTTLIEIDTLLDKSPDKVLAMIGQFTIYTQNIEEKISEETPKIKTNYIAQTQITNQFFISSSNQQNNNFNKFANQTTSTFKTRINTLKENYEKGVEKEKNEQTTKQTQLFKNAFVEIDKSVADKRDRVAKVNAKFKEDLIGGVNESLKEAKKPLESLEERCNEAAIEAGKGWLAGIVSALGDIVKGLLIVVLLAALLVAFVAFLGGTLAFGTAMLIVGLTLLAVSAVSAFVNRRNQGFTVGSSLGLALTDSLALTGLYESIKGREVGTGKKLSTYARSKKATEGVFSVAMIFFGGRGAIRKWRGLPPQPFGPFARISKFIPENIKIKASTLGELAKVLTEERLPELGKSFGEFVGRKTGGRFEPTKLLPELNKRIEGSGVMPKIRIAKEFVLDIFKSKPKPEPKPSIISKPHEEFIDFFDDGRQNMPGSGKEPIKPIEELVNTKPKSEIAESEPLSDKKQINVEEVQKTAEKNLNPDDIISKYIDEGSDISPKELAIKIGESLLKALKEEKIAGRKMPKSVSVWKHKKTGRIIVGKNGTLTKGNPEPVLNEGFEPKFWESSKENRPAKQCSEADAANQVYENNGQPNEYEQHTIGFEGNRVVDKHTCRNCDVNLSEEIEGGNISSNTPEALKRRNDAIERFKPKD